MKSLICRITCNAIPNLTCNMILCCIVVLPAECNTILNLSYLSLMADLQCVQNVRFRWRFCRKRSFTVHSRLCLRRSWENRMFIQDYAWELSLKLECSFKTMLENCLEKLECSFKTMLENCLEKIECSFKTMLENVFKGRLTDLENVPFLKLILTLYLDCWRVAAQYLWTQPKALFSEGVLSLVSCLEGLSADLWL